MYRAGFWTFARRGSIRGQREGMSKGSLPAPQRAATTAAAPSSGHGWPPPSWVTNSANPLAAGPSGVPPAMSEDPGWSERINLAQLPKTAHVDVQHQPHAGERGQGGRASV